MDFSNQHPTKSEVKININLLLVQPSTNDKYVDVITFTFIFTIIKICLFPEVTPVLASYSENKFQFRKLLQWSESYELFSSSSLGSDGVNGSAVFLAVLQASQILPSNGALLIFTDRAVADEDLATLALSDAAKKRIRVIIASRI